jgi:hypothetical protein
MGAALRLTMVMCEQVLCNVVILNLLAATAISGMPTLVVRY